MDDNKDNAVMTYEQKEQQKRENARKRFKKFYDSKIKDKDNKRKCDRCGKEIAYMNYSKHRKTARCINFTNK